MKKKLLLMFAFILAVGFGVQSVSAQFKININVPKRKKETTEKPATTPNNQTGRKPTTNNQPIWLTTTLDEIGKVKKQVDEHSSNDEDLYGYSTFDYVAITISKKVREEWVEKNFAPISPQVRNQLDVAMDDLLASLTKKLPTYRGNLAKYEYHTPAEEKVLRAFFKPANFKIFATGFLQNRWLIEQNDYGNPIARYKQGVVYVRKTSSDHPYCYLYYTNVAQDYAGGGTYGESYALNTDTRSEVVGCPLTK